MGKPGSFLLVTLCGAWLAVQPAVAATYSSEDLQLLAHLSTQGGALGQDISRAAVDAGGRDANASQCLSSLADEAIGVGEAAAGLAALVSVDVQMRSAKDDQAAAQVIKTELDGLQKTVENRREAATKLEARCDFATIASKEESLAGYLDSVDQEIEALRAKLVP